MHSHVIATHRAKVIEMPQSAPSQSDIDLEIEVLECDLAELKTIRARRTNREAMSQELKTLAREGWIEDLGNGRYRALPPELRKAKTELK
jgi:hypothetical protein